jgi:hypothetical protein
MPDSQVLLFLVIAALVLIGVFYGWYAAKRRREALAAWAAAYGLAFRADRDDGFDNHYEGFDCLCKGSNRYAYNICEGVIEGHGVRAFDYHYETYSHGKHGRQTHHHHFSAVIITTDFPLKPLFIRPETFLDKVTEFFGYDDIDFESAEFSRKFYVKSPDKRWAYDVISQATMEFLLAAPRFTLQFGGLCVIAYRGSKFEIPDFDAALQLADGLIERLPPSLVQELRGGRENECRSS